MADFQNIIYEKKGRLAYITINRPDRRNAIDPLTSKELYDAFHDFKDDPEVWVAIVTGAGDVAFCAGADLVAMAEAFSGRGGQSYNVPFAGITRGFECWKPIIAAINGYCLAGGLELALCCDIRIAAEHATFGCQHINFALMPGGGNTQRLPRKLGWPRAMALLLTGRWITGKEAEAWGLVYKAVPADKLEEELESLLSDLRSKSRQALGQIKRTALEGLNLPLSAAVRLEISAASCYLATSQDVREGLAAFLERRRPTF